MKRFLKYIASRGAELVLSLALVLLFFLSFMGLLGLTFPEGTSLKALMLGDADPLGTGGTGDLNLVASYGANTRIPFIARLTQTERTVKDKPANAIAWKGEEPRLTVTIQAALPSELPASLQHSALSFTRLRIEDNGAGVAHEDKDQIFRLFFSRNPQGKGIGLSMCRKYIRAFGGEILEAGTPGVGARFDLFLPRSRPGRPE